METTEQHFAEHPERLEDFVLGRMDPAARILCEQHLRVCETCRQAVHVEEIIAAGIKRTGRERLKKRIGMLAGIPPRRQIPWPHVLSVAAILLILVGVGITQHWFVTRVEQTEIVAVEKGPQRDQKAVSPEAVAPQARNEQGTPPQDAAPSTKPDTRQLDAERSSAPRESNLKGGAKVQGYDRATADRLEEAPAVSEKDTRRADIPQPSMITGANEQEFWTNGVLIADSRLKKEADESKTAPLGAITNSVHDASAHRAPAEPLGRVTVDQRPLSALPPNQQSQQQLYSRQTIQTLVRQSENETELTLYPESPFDSTQLHYARVQQVGPDSLIVHIGGQRISYRLPSGAMMQRQTETSKAKRR